MQNSTMWWSWNASKLNRLNELPLVRQVTVLRESTVATKRLVVARLLGIASDHYESSLRDFNEENRSRRSESH
jgi:hypothetical protein